MSTPAASSKPVGLAGAMPTALPPHRALSAPDGRKVVRAGANRPAQHRFFDPTHDTAGNDIGGETSVLSNFVRNNAEVFDMIYGKMVTPADVVRDCARRFGNYTNLAQWATNKVDLGEEIVKWQQSLDRTGEPYVMPYQGPAAERLKEYFAGMPTKYTRRLATYTDEDWTMAIFYFEAHIFRGTERSREIEHKLSATLGGHTLRSTQVSRLYVCLMDMVLVAAQNTRLFESTAVVVLGDRTREYTTTIPKQVPGAWGVNEFVSTNRFLVAKKLGAYAGPKLGADISSVLEDEKLCAFLVASCQSGPGRWSVTSLVDEEKIESELTRNPLRALLSLLKVPNAGIVKRTTKRGEVQGL